MKNSLLKQLLGLSLSLITYPACAANPISVSDAFARAVPPGVSNSAAFMVLHNPSSAERRLVAAHSTLAKKVELHEHSMDNGVMRMRQVPEIRIPPKGQTQLRPGGYHVMFLGLNHPIKPGDRVTVTLQFANGEHLPVEMTASKMAPPTSHNHSVH